MNTSEGPWNPDEHTNIEKSTSFGTVQFSGFGKESSKRDAWYVRVDHKTKPEQLWDLMANYWKLPRPKMLISVTGGAKLSLIPKLKQSFKEGLINVATSTGAWIITGGTNNGVMALVGEAVNDYNLEAGAEDANIICIGFATWGVIKNNDALTSKGDGNFPAIYRKDVKKDKKQGAYLDNNHSHFILVDNGKVNSFGAEIDLRTTMEEHIANQKIPSESAQKEVKVPIVLLVVDGGENTLETVHEALKHGTTVVVIGGSGRAANFIEIAFKMTASNKNEDDYQIPDNFNQEMKDQASRLFDITSNDAETEKKKEKFASDILSIVTKHRQLVYVFKLDDSEGTIGIDKAILYALLRAKKEEVQTQLALSLAWNRCDIAREEIFESQNKREPVEIGVMHELLFSALLQDRVEFVELFMEHGADFHSYITASKLVELYREIITEEKNDAAVGLLDTLFERAESKRNSSSLKNREKTLTAEETSQILILLGRVLDNLLGNEYKFAHHYSNLRQQSQSEETPAEANEDNREFDPIRELFLWSLLLSRKELALLFWKAGKDHIGGALIASALCKNLASAADSEERIDLSAKMTQMSEYFESLAYDVLDECFERDKDKTHQLLVRELICWQNQTLFSISYSAKQLDFMGHAACQTKLNYIWRGKITTYTSRFKIIGSLFLPPLIWTIKFVGRKDDDSFDRVNEKARNNQVVPLDSDVDSPNDQEPNRKDKKPSHKVKIACQDLPKVALSFYRSPLIKFSYDIISQLVYLALFSYFVLVDLKPLSNNSTSSLAITEYIIWAWTFTLFLEQIRKVVVQEPENPGLKLVYYFQDAWAWFDLIINGMFIASICLRFTLSGENFIWARIFYSSTLGLFYLHFMYAFYAERIIGPKVIIIQQMMMDLIFFGLLWVLFLFAYGVMVEALQYPGAGADWTRLKRILYNPYWQMYNTIDQNVQLGLYDMCGNSTGPDNFPEQCQSPLWFILLACAIYSLLTAILLLNMLIAMFSFTFETVQENSEKIWRFYRYGLVKDYLDRPELPPPLIILIHVYRFFAYLIQLCSNSHRIGHEFLYVISKETPKTNTNSCIITVETNKQLTQFERSSMENFMRSEKLEANRNTDVQVSSVSQRVDRVIDQLDKLKEQLSWSQGAKTTESVRMPDSQLSNQMTETIYALHQQLGLFISKMKTSEKKA